MQFEITIENLADTDNVPDVERNNIICFRKKTSGSASIYKKFDKVFFIWKCGAMVKNIK